MAARTFGKYTLLRRVGIGGMAEVYEGQLRGAAGFSKQLAIKLLLPELQREQRVVDMFIDEATLAAGLSHPNVVQVFDFGEIDGSYFMAMEFVDGWDLRQLCWWSRHSARPFPVAAGARVVAQLCRALDYIHHAERRIIHRDVTPHNVFVTRHGTVKLGDFGIAKAGARRSHTEQGQIKGKLAYLAPEQVRGDPVDVQTDVYAAGLILFELLAGRRLIDAERDVDLLRIAQDPPDCAIAHVRPEARPLEPALRRALRANIKLRFPTAALFAGALEQYLERARFSADDLAAFAGTLAPAVQPTQQRPGPATARARRATPRAGPATGSAQGTTQLGAARQDAWRAGPWRSALIASGAAIVAMGVAVALSWRDTGRHPRPLPATGERSAAVDHVASSRVRAAAAAPATAVPVLDTAPPAPGSDGGQASGPIHALPPHPATVRNQRRSPRRSPGRRSRTSASAAREADSADESQSPPSPAAPDAALVAQRLDSLLRHARSRGLWPGDGPLDHAVLARIRSDLRGGKVARASIALDGLDQAVQRFRSDRQFVERKLARLERAIQQRNPDAEQRRRLATLSQQILGMIMDRRLVEASRLISEAMERLGR